MHPKFGEIQYSLPVRTCTSSSHYHNSQMRSQLIRLLRTSLQKRSITTKWQPMTSDRSPTPTSLRLPEGLNKAEITRRKEALIRNLFTAEKADVVEEIIEARRGMWDGLNGGEMPYCSALSISPLLLLRYCCCCYLKKDMKTDAYSNTKASKNQISEPRTRTHKRARS